MMKRETVKVSTKSTDTSVRLPKKPRLNAQARSPRPDSWQNFFDSELRPTDDFMAERINSTFQKRE